MKTITHSVIITLALVLQTFSYAACNSSNGTKCTAKTAPKVKEPTATDLSSGTYNQKTYYYYKHSFRLLRKAMCRPTCQRFYQKQRWYFHDSNTVWTGC